MKVGKDLRALRTNRGLSLREAGARCGFAGDELAAYERGETNPRQGNTQKLAQVLNEPISQIQDGVAWTEHEEDEVRQDLRGAILELLRESYGTAEEQSFQNKQGNVERYFTVGSAPNQFALYEKDISALEEFINALLFTLAEHMKDSRPEKEIVRDILRQMNRGLPIPEDESAYDLTDQEWEAVKDVFPPENANRGRAFKDNRLILNAILYWMHTGVSWEKLPKRYGRYRTVYDRLVLWNKQGVWSKALQRMLELGIVSEETIIYDGLR